MGLIETITYYLADKKYIKQQPTKREIKSKLLKKVLTF